ncbi:hypothetical protein BKA82DRAFT_4017820 [Pisolithus tinctorius]|nr:hypothetical protein BKA82DRAFT_4017820 [Pisolithus tinctorius]
MYSQARPSGRVSGHSNVLPGHPDDPFTPPSQSDRPSANTSGMTDHQSHQFRDVEMTSPVDPHEAPPYPYLGGSQPNQPIGYKPYQGDGNGHERTTPVYSSRSVHSQSNSHGHSEVLVQGHSHILQATVTQIMVDIRNLTEGKMNLEEELARLKEDNKTVTSHLDALEQSFAELREKGEVALKQASSRTSSNDHTAVKWRTLGTYRRRGRDLAPQLAWAGGRQAKH